MAAVVFTATGRVRSVATNRCAVTSGDGRFDGWPGTRQRRRRV